MAQRLREKLNECPVCKENFRIQVLEILNPETIDMNANAKLKCLKCENEWSDKVTSPHHRELRNKGYRR